MNYRIVELLNSGYLYVHGRDSKFRPIIILNLELLSEIKGKYNDSEFETAAIKFIDYIIHNLLLPGQIENWIFVIFIGNSALFSLKDQIVKIITAMQNNYPGRLYRSYILGLSTLMSYAWMIIKAFLSATTVKKFFVLKDSDWCEMHKLINQSQIEKRFGGIAENINYSNTANSTKVIKYLFPPSNISDYYLLKDEDPKEILVDDQTYITTLNKDKRFISCPHLINELKSSIYEICDLPETDKVDLTGKNSDIETNNVTVGTIFEKST